MKEFLLGIGLIVAIPFLALRWLIWQFSQESPQGNVVRVWTDGAENQN